MIKVHTFILPYLFVLISLLASRILALLVARERERELRKGGRERELRKGGRERGGGERRGLSTFFSINFTFFIEGISELQQAVLFTVKTSLMLVQQTIITVFNFCN